MSVEDQVLVDRTLKSNDQLAFAELVKRYQSRLRYSLRQLTGWDEALADDLAQETFLKAYKGLSQYHGKAKFYTWLYKIAYNCFLANYRKKKHYEQQISPGDDTYHSDTNREAELHRDFARALMVFQPDQRMTLHLHFQRELTHQEISDIMNCPLGTVKSHIQRGRIKLQERLGSWQTGD